MNASKLIELIIDRHESNDSNDIIVHKTLRLEPVLDYGGKMARKAYQTYRKNWHTERRFCGFLDFKIMDPTGKMEHSQLLARSIGLVPIEAIRYVYDGGDPYDLELSDEQLALACDIQCSFMEQEVNWGIHPFQLRTHFGYPDMVDDTLRNSVPRDFFMMFFERCDEAIRNGSSVSDVLRLIDEHYEHSYVASKMVIMPPISGGGNNRKIKKEWLPYVRSAQNINSESWITPHLGRILPLIESRGVSPHFEKTYRSNKHES
jgi:hypothetical protein